MNNQNDLGLKDPRKNKKSKSWIGIIFFVLVIGIVAFFAYNAYTEYMNQEYYVRFYEDSNSWTACSSVKTKGNERIELPENPTKKGYVFDGWYVDQGTWQDKFTEDYLLNKKLDRDLKVYAKWVEKEGPKEISTASELKSISLDGDYILTNDIDLENDYWACNFGSKESPFTGTFDGNGYTISNIRKPLFAYSSGIIKNVGIENANIEFDNVYSYSSFGCLVNVNDGTVSNCFVSSSDLTIKVDDVGATVGLLVGRNNNIVENCYTKEHCGVSVLYGSRYRDSYDYSAGGLIGTNWGVVDLCYAGGSADAYGADENSAGGLVGLNYGTIKRSYSTGYVDANTYAGGLVGCNYGSIIHSYSSALTSSSGTAGGLVGYMREWSTGKGLIINCYASGNVSGGKYAGGFIGENQDCYVANCYSVGFVSSSGGTKGGFIASNYGTVSNCYQSSSDNADISSVLVATTSNLKSKQWVELNLWRTELDAWEFSSDYPVINKDFSNRIIEISTAEDLNKLQGAALTCDYKLTADIDLKGAEWNPIICVYGTFDGNGYCISNFKFSNPGYKVGFISHNLGNIDGLSITDCTIDITSTNDFYLGVLVAYNEGGRITECNVSANVNLNYTNEYQYNYAVASGMVGYNNNGVVSGCTTNVPISVIIGEDDGSFMLGGLVGVNYDESVIKDSNYTGNITVNVNKEDTDVEIGGITANNAGEINNCYAMSTINVNTVLSYSSVEVGILAGTNEGVITNSSTTGTVKLEADSIDSYSSAGTGGLVGSNGGSISNSYASADVQSIGTAGGLVAYNSSSISSSYAIGNIESGNRSGGLAGSNSGRIENCYSIGKVTSNGTAGGLVASNSGVIKKSYSSGNVIGNEYAGGFAGSSSGTITQCYSTGSSEAKDYDGRAGGFVGSNTGNVNNCYATGNVITSTTSTRYSMYAGGFVGYNYGDFNEKGVIKNCYATGNVTSQKYAGGFVGYSYMGTIENCFAVGNVSAGDTTGSQVGGFIGYNDLGVVNNCYRNSDQLIEGETISNDGTQKTTTELQSKAFIDSLGWDATIWQCIDGTAPTLIS